MIKIIDSCLIERSFYVQLCSVWYFCQGMRKRYRRSVHPSCRYVIIDWSIFTSWRMHRCFEIKIWMYDPLFISTNSALRYLVFWLTGSTQMSIFVTAFKEKECDSMFHEYIQVSRKTVLTVLWLLFLVGPFKRIWIHPEAKPSEE